MKDVDQKLLIMFGENIRKYRLKQKMTQLDLSVRAEMDIRTLQRIEKAELSIRLVTAIRLAKALGISLEKLM